MTITVNGSTNTITAPSGLTIAGNTAVTGTLSTSGDVSLSTVGSAVNFATTASAITNYIKTFSDGFSLELFVNRGVSKPSYLLDFGGTHQLGFNGVAVATVSSTGLVVTGTLSASSHILPTIDNTSNLGSAALGMKELFSDNGTINTSDARRKTEVSALSAAEINAAKQLAKEIGSFKFLAAVAEKGDAARLHIGMTVQRAIEIMEANGFDPFAYSFICHDAWDQQVVEHAAVEAKDAVLDADGNVAEPAVEAKDAWTEVTLEAGDKYSFRVHELLLFMAAGFEARLSALEAA